jgi:hypothetical protein
VTLSPVRVTLHVTPGLETGFYASLSPRAVDPSGRPARPSGPRLWLRELLGWATTPLLVTACLALAIAAAVLVGAGVLVGSRFVPGGSSAPDRVTVRVIEDSARGGPQDLATAIVPLS